MLIAFLPSVCAQAGGSGNGTRTGPPARAGQIRKQRLSDVRKGGGDRELFRSRAEAAFDRAALLRQKQTSKELKAAIGLFQKSARLFQAGRLYAQAADAYIQIGEIHFIMSEYEEALSSYGMALRLPGGDPDRRCQALSHMARTYANTGRNSEADNYSKQALSLSEGLANPRTQAEALEARGEVLYWAADSLHAVEPFTRARDLFIEAKDDEGQALALLMLAEARFMVGEVAAASRLAEQALGLWISNRSSYGVAQARTMLATFAIMAGQFEPARCNSEVALPVFQKANDKDSTAIVLNILGYASMEMGDPEKSLDYYRQARAAFHSLQDWLGEANAITGMATALKSLHRYEQTLPLYAAKLRLAQLAKNPLQIASALADMGGVYELKHEYGKAETLYRRSLKTYREAHNPYREGDILIALARIASAQKKYFQAISLLQQALAVKGQAAQVADLAKIQYEQAYIYRRLNQLQDALAAIEKPIDFIESQRLTISQFDSRASYFASVHKYYALYIQVLMLLHAQDPQAGFAEKAFAAAEKSKVRALLDLLTTSSKIAPCEDLWERQLAARTEVRALDPAETSAAAAGPISLAEVQAEIGSDGTTLLEYALGDEKSYVWVVDQRQIVSYELPGAVQIQKVAALLRESLVPLQRKHGEKTIQLQARRRDADWAYQRYARQLSRLVLAPAELSHAKRLLIVPDGPLQYIPFAVLPLSASGEHKTILINHHEVVVLPSASALSTLRKAAAKRKPPAKVAAIFADPVFRRDDDRFRSHLTAKKPQELPSDLTRAILDMHGSLYIPRLMGSRQEAAAILQILGPKDVLLASDFAATRDRFLKEDIGSYRILHIATHGIIDIQHPEMSGLILSLISKEGRTKDGYVRLGDIYHLKLSADLVILSACDSALGRDLDSEGIIGLPRGFLYAGARSVIASLWKVDDQATATLMAGLYRRMHQGETPGAALRGAQLEMVRQGSKPADWAAFVLQGDYK